MRRPKRLATFALPVAAAMLLASCGGGSSDDGDSGDSGSEGASGGSITVSGTEPEAFAPTSQCYSSDCSQIISLVWTGLQTIDPETNETVPGMAESIESEDGKVWTIKLKDGFTFHNGEPVDAQSFLRAWNYAAYGPNATQVGFFFSPVVGYDEVSGAKPKAKEMSGLKAVDDTTIEVTLTEAFSQWPLVMTYAPAFVPMAEECEKDIKACNEQPIGNGPYEFAEPWDHNKSISLQKYADYSDEETDGNVDEIQFKFYGDLKTAFRDFEAGNVDIVNEVDPSQEPQAKAKYGDQIYQEDDGSFSYLGFPFYEEQYQDPNIRRALSMSIDRDTITEQVLNGSSTSANDVIPEFLGGRDDACANCEYDPEEAKRLWDEAGGVPGNKVTLWFNNDGGHELWTQAVADGWKKDLGVDVEFKSQPFTPFLKTLDTRKDVDGPYRLGWLPDYPSPENYLDPIYGEGSSNYGDWGIGNTKQARDQFLAKIAEGDSAASVEEGTPAYLEAADVVLEELPVIPLWFGTSFVLYADNIDNVVYSPFDQIMLKDVTAS
jgi:oligopeptide transport system substrate-binding protein